MNNNLIKVYIYLVVTMVGTGILTYFDVINTDNGINVFFILWIVMLAIMIGDIIITITDTLEGRK